MEPERHLRTSNGQRLLLTPPQNLGFGVHVDRQVMRLGFLEAAELSREIEPPSMYEEEGLGQGKGESSPFDRKVIHEEFRVRLSDPTCLVKGSVKIEGVEVFDETLRPDDDDRGGQLPILSVSYFNTAQTEEDWEDLLDFPVDVNHEPTRFCLDCYVPSTYRGSILRWVIFTVSAEMITPVPTQEVLTKFSFGLSFNCTIVDDVKPLRALSTESRSFIPQFMKAYFDRPGTLSIYWNNI